MGDLEDEKFMQENSKMWDEYVAIKFALPIV